MRLTPEHGAGSGPRPLQRLEPDLQVLCVDRLCEVALLATRLRPMSEEVRDPFEKSMHGGCLSGGAWVRGPESAAVVAAWQVSWVSAREDTGLR